jgi:hypothetical protein
MVESNRNQKAKDPNCVDVIEELDSELQCVILFQTRGAVSFVERRPLHSHVEE